MYGGGDSYGGYNDGGGASQFAGGGFMPSPAGKMDNGGTGYSPVQGARGGGKAEHMTGLLPVTIRQISTVNPRDENVIIDGQVVNNVTLVARVVHKEIRRTDASFTIDDGTGSIGMKQWLTADDPDEESRLTKIGENTYIRVYGHIRSLEGKLTLQAFSIRPVKEPNEITFHNLECIFVHAVHTKGELGAAAPSQIPMGSGMTTPQAVRPSNLYGAGEPPSGAAGAAPQQRYGTPSPYGAPPQNGPASMGGAALSELQGRILAIYDDPALASVEEGLSYREVAGRIPGFTMAAIKETIDFLVNEGHLYSTIDEEHFKSTSS